MGFDPQFGARPIKRVIQKTLLNELSKMILEGKVHKERRLWWMRKRENWCSGIIDPDQ